MSDQTRPTLASPELVARYLEGVPERCRDFEFLVGEWSVQATRYADDGSEAMHLTGVWVAESLYGGRLVFDRFEAFMPDGRALSSTATLRTWCETTECWEMTFLFSGQPNRLESFTGRKVGEEMHLEAKGLDLLGRPVDAKVRFFDIGGDRFTWDQRSRLEGGDHWFLDGRMWATRVA